MSAENPFHSLRYLRMDARRLEHLATLALPLDGKTVLEVGAGIGDLTSFFLDRGCTVTSVEPRRENIQVFLSRYGNSGFWPDAQLRVVHTDVYRLAEQSDILPHQIVLCYGLLYHLERPERALRTLAERCSEMLLLETAVAYGSDADEIAYAYEDAVAPTNSITGTACAPSRRWVFNRLSELFAHVYMPLTQPHHDQFRLDWRHTTAPAGRSRAIFIASRMPLHHSLLMPYVPSIQYHDLPQPGRLAGLARSGVTLVDSIFGPLLAYDNDLITQQLRAFGAHTRNELAMLMSFVDEGDLIYDVGAHIGTFTLPLAGATGTAGRVIAIEPDPGHFALLQRNLEARGLARQDSPLNVAVADMATGFGTRAVPGNSGATWLAPDASGATAKAHRLDDIHRTGGETRRVALIKVDVEGLELSVLASAMTIIDTDHPLLYLEVSAEQLARYGATPGQIEDFLRSRSYRLFRNVGDRNSSHDRFELAELATIAAGGPFFDLLAISESDPRLERASAAVRAAAPRSR